jgi:outer membrane receptor protein involved in Fe transport
MRLRTAETVTLTLFGGVENLFDQKYYETVFRHPVRWVEAGSDLDSK